MKHWIQRQLRRRGLHLYTSDSLPYGVDWVHDIGRHSKLSRTAAPVCFDVGANVGQTVKAITEVFPQAWVHAFEPFAEPLNLLRDMAKARPRVLVVPAALGSVAGEIFVEPHHQSVLNTLRNSTTSTSPGLAKQSSGERINILTLDEYCDGEGILSAEILKIDTEGYDAEVLRGAKSMLERNAFRYVYVEVTFLQSNPNNTQFDEVYSILSDSRYRLLGLYETYSMYNFPPPNHFCNALFVTSAARAE